MSEIVLITSDGSMVCKPYVVNKVEPKEGLSCLVDAEQNALEGVREQSETE